MTLRQMTFFIVGGVIMTSAFVFALTAQPTTPPTVAALPAALDQSAPTAPVLAEPTSSTTTVIFVGDMMFDRYIRQQSLWRGYDAVFAKTTPLLEIADTVVANLEGPITASPSVSMGSVYPDPHNFVFTFPPTIAKELARFNFGAVSLANNHSTNFGRTGIEETKQYLSAAGVAYFGDPYGGAVSTVLTLKGQKIALVGFNQFGGPNVPKVVEEINRLQSTVDWVVVIAHWGVEYESEPNADQIEWAHKFVDAGADLVIGAHPHVIQSKEMYRGIPIYYSLGNFIFDQYFSPAVRCGLILETIFEVGQPIKIMEHHDYLEKDGSTSLENCR
jgi:poly-gamma-glutamate synthesis protein (capsule biosynthesis protein)